MTHEWLHSRFVKFLLGGGVTVVFEYASFYATYVMLHWNLLAANSLSFGIGLGISFLFNRLWAFRQAAFHRKMHHQATLYVVLAITNLLLNNGIVSGLKTLGVDPRGGKILAIICIAVWNFVIYRKVIFIAREETLDAQITKD